MAKKTKEKDSEETQVVGKPRYEIKYKDEIVPALKEDFKFTSVMQVPRLIKIVVNMGMSDVREDPKQLDSAIGDLRVITGQQPIRTKSKKAISNFKIREGWDIGTKVTLRGKRMYEFLDRFINIAVPRIRDFRGMPIRAFDGRGNYSIGVREQLIFPEIDYDKVDKVRGMDITIVTSANTDKEGHALLHYFGMPFATQ